MRPSTRPLGRWTIALAITMLVAAACGPAAAPSGAGAPATSAAPTAAAPKSGGELRFMLLQDAQTFDPAKTTESTAFTINSAIYDTLVEIQPDGSLVPAVAESWKISDDGRAYTFKLVSGIKFHNGRTMTSTDVKFTLDRLRDPATKSPRAVLYQAVTSVEAPDPGTVVVSLKEPFAPLLAVLADISAGIVAKEAVDAGGGDVSKAPIATGPFKFVEWVRDQHVKVEAFTDHWRKGKPHLQRIVFRYNNDANARGAAVRAGDVDFLFDAPAALHTVFQGDAQLAIHGGAGQLNWLYLLLNMQKDPFKDVRVRQAVFTALDRAELANIGMPGLSNTLNGGFLPPTHWAGVTDTVYRKDIEKARQLLAQAGYASGFRFTINALTGWDFQIRTAQTIQQQLKPLGIEAEVRVIDSAQLLTAARQGDFQAQILGFSGTIDPDERFQQTFVTGGGTNWGKLSDSKIDDLVTQARKTTDRSGRAKLYREAQLRAAEVGPFAFLYNYYKFDVLRKDVKGYVFNTQLISYRALRDVWLDR